MHTLSISKLTPNTTRLGAEKGLIKIRVTPPSSIRGASVIVGSEGQPQIQVETKRWTFTLSISRAGEIGVIADDVVKDAGKAFEGAFSIGGTDYATGRFLIYYVQTTFDTAVALTKEVPDSRRFDGKRTELLAILRDDFSLLLVPLKALEPQIRR
jgi:hypothetical protein